jgi:RNA recognition motif-containing protein
LVIPNINVNFLSPVIGRNFFTIIFRGSRVSTKLFVGSLPWSVDDSQLQEAFEGHGTVVSAKVVKDRETGRSRGFGFVEMENAEQAQSAIKALNDSELDGRNIVVNEAKARS